MIEATRVMPDRQPEAPRSAQLPMPLATLLFGLLLSVPSAPALAQREPVPFPVQPAPSTGAPPADEARARCDSFARLHRYAEQSKALCEEGRQVKAGPVTTKILEQCRALEGDQFDRQPVNDMMDNLTRQISEQGIGNACHAASVQAWDLISQ